MDPDIPKLTEEKTKKLMSLLADWEDDNISDFAYCNLVGDILGLGRWTLKGKERIDLENPHGPLKEMEAEEQRVQSLLNKIMKNTHKNLSKEDKKIFNKLRKDEDTERVLGNVAWRALVLCDKIGETQ